jgi:hypothetical protein
LCQKVPDPPPGLEIKPPEVDPNVPTRERFIAHSQDPACSACHQMMDPIGFGFLNFDAIGEWHAEDGEFEADPRGELVFTDVDGEFDGPRELAERLAGSNVVQTCLATQWLRYALGRPETEAERCAVDQLAAYFGTQQLNFEELIVAVASSAQFSHLGRETEAP